MDTQKIVAELKRERDRLSHAIAALEGQPRNSNARSGAKAGAKPHGAAGGAKKRGRLTPEGRKRLSDLMKKRWAERKKKGTAKR